MEVKTHYDTDLTDKQWQIIKKFIPKQKKGPKQICRRRIINAIRFLVRTGCQWRNLPYDFPKCSNIFRAVYNGWKHCDPQSVGIGVTRVSSKRFTMPYAEWYAWP